VREGHAARDSVITVIACKQRSQEVKKILLALTAVVAIGVAVPVALGATHPASVPTMGNKLTCFDGTTDGGFYGLCTVTKAGVATLDNESNDSTGTTNPYDQYSGVYLKNSNLVGKAIRTVNQLGFSYTGIATAGSPRISLGIDTDRDGNWNHFAFISAFYCNDGAGNVDVMKDPTCTIYSGSDVYVNWAAMVAAHPEYRVGHTPFVIADDPGTWTVFNVKLGKGPAGGLKN
jgi:hypothetical protein